MPSSNHYRKLYLSHLLTSWVDRSFEFASFLLIAGVYRTSLFQSSVYNLTTTLVALIFSNRVGNWINILSRLNTFRITLFAQKLCIIISTILFHYLDNTSGTTRDVLFGVIVFLGCILKLAFIGNSIAIEKDWAIIISNGHLELLLPTMRRINLTCKTIAPIFIGYLLYTSEMTVTLTICIWTAVSTVIEYILVIQIHREVPRLENRAAFSTTYSAISNREDQEDEAEQGNEDEAAVAISPMGYLRHRTFLATLSLGIMYVNVLSFGGTMTSYLVLIGYDSRLLGIMKAFAGIMGVAGTFLMPVFSNRVGNLRTGLWSTWQLAISLVAVTVALTNRLDYMTTSILLFGGTAVSRIGLWIFDIAESLILQEYSSSAELTSITGWQYSMCNFFELMQYVLTIVIDDPADFIIPATVSTSMIVGAAIIYSIFVYKERGHLFHFKMN